MSKQYKLYRVECLEENTPIDKEDNAIGISDLEYMDKEYYMVEIWSDEYHYADHKEFQTLEDAVRFMEEEEAIEQRAKNEEDYDKFMGGE